MAALRAKSIALTELFIARVEARCAGLGLALVTPRAAGERGSQASFAHADGYPVMQALIERGVIGDFRAGEPADAGGAADDSHAGADLLRFGFTPLYTRFVDVWDAAEQLRDVLASECLSRAALQPPCRGHLMSDPKPPPIRPPSSPPSRPRSTSAAT